MKPALFLDRDGTLNVERHYLSDPTQLELFPGVIPALKRIQDAGYLLFIVTNQSGIGRGYFTEAAMHAVHRELRRQLQAHGVEIAHIYFAPEAPDQPSRGRKPSPHFLWEARDAYGVDLSRSYLVGDKLLDLETGWNAELGASLLVRTGYGPETEREAAGLLDTTPVFDHLSEVADWICAPPQRRILGVIPARYGSTRFPGKPLAPIAGKPLIQRVVEQCRQADALAEVIVATDDDRIRRVAEGFCRVAMTRSDHPSGTDRIAEVVRTCACDGVVNIQGDEPLIHPQVINRVARALNAAPMTTAVSPLIDPAELDSPNVVKVVVNRARCALYFSRRTIPYLRDAVDRSSAEQLAAFPFLKHVGLYGYRRETLLRLVGCATAPLEQAERLEQLRALDAGIPIRVVRVDHDSVGVDVPADIARVEALLASAR
jgi:3-deoxy-manno-octulosonate cytidylyltransferase (CMP-KDO synthetase)